ncbi:MAG: fumarylacetoacetate hydrolase family protein, partial [Opitutaceae bacterium]|nr:fumarylacetoacetate hydrolase family protein [Opitutaceae bacterium]
MRLIRHLTPAGPAYAALQPDGTAWEIAGNIFGDFRITDRTVKPGRLLAPVVPVNLLAIGLNYKKHAEEGGRGAPEKPVLFLKATSAVQNPGDPIEIPQKLASCEVDYECELAVVIGRRCKNASRAQALDYVLGYTCANDVSARDWQRKPWGGGQWSQAKSFDTFCPLGPVLVTRDEIPDPNHLRIRTLLNGQAMQDWNTNDM